MWAMIDQDALIPKVWSTSVSDNHNQLRKGFRKICSLILSVQIVKLHILDKKAYIYYEWISDRVLIIIWQTSLNRMYLWGQCWEKSLYPAGIWTWIIVLFLAGDAPCLLFAGKPPGWQLWQTEGGDIGSDWSTPGVWPTRPFFYSSLDQGNCCHLCIDKMGNTCC